MLAGPVHIERDTPNAEFSLFRPGPPARAYV